jgi:hypothetical protein
MREDIPISKRVRASFMVNTDKEYMAGLRYIVNKNIGLTTHYDSDMGSQFLTVIFFVAMLPKLFGTLPVPLCSTAKEPSQHTA